MMQFVYYISTEILQQLYVISLKRFSAELFRRGEKHMFELS